MCVLRFLPAFHNLHVQLPFAFVSASEGTNVVKVFTEAVRIGKVMLCHDTRADGSAHAAAVAAAATAAAAAHAAADVPGKSGKRLFRRSHGPHRNRLQRFCCCSCAFVVNRRSFLRFIADIPPHQSASTDE